MKRGGRLPSFDIVSRIDLAEVDNALAGITREIGDPLRLQRQQMHDRAAGRHDRRVRR